MSLGSQSAAPVDLAALQNSIKRDPESYKDDFLLQLRHLEAHFDLFNLAPGDGHSGFAAQISFISQVSFCYPAETANFPSRVAGLLTE